jgi:hypothetical protein
MSENLSISLENMLPQITEEVAAKLRERALASLTYQVEDAIKVKVRGYIEENILPTVQKELEAHDSEIRAAFVAAVVAASQAVAAKVKEAAEEKLTSWGGEKLVGELMSKIFSRY